MHNVNNVTLHACLCKNVTFTNRWPCNPLAPTYGPLLHNLYYGGINAHKQKTKLVIHTVITCQLLPVRFAIILLCIGVDQNHFEKTRMHGKSSLKTFPLQCFTIVPCR